MDGPALYPTMAYRDPRAAIEWLERAFGFERMVVHPEEGPVMHAELAVGTGVLMVTTLDEKSASQPNRGYNAPYVYVADPDAHHARATAAGAEVTRPLENTFYGSREYSVRDLEGNEWSFGTYRPLPTQARQPSGGTSVSR
ncbi:MAG TPA: VOC family protein [Vicinamibacterales bacterium]|nr:VOC family protein [Vicinamibacterales bacterium]